MPSKPKKSSGADPVAAVMIPLELLDRVVKEPMTSDEVQTVCRSLKEAVTERAMNAETSQHAGCVPGDAEPAGQANHSNGNSGETAPTDDGSVRIAVPRDRDGSYEPILIRSRDTSGASPALTTRSSRCTPSG